MQASAAKSAFNNGKTIDYSVLDSIMNLLCTVNVLEGREKHNVPYILFSSSVPIFGELQNDKCMHFRTEVLFENGLVNYLV